MLPTLQIEKHSFGGSREWIYDYTLEIASIVEGRSPLHEIERLLQSRLIQNRIRSILLPYQFLSASLLFGAVCLALLSITASECGETTTCWMGISQL